MTDLASFVHEVLATEFNATGLDTYLSGFFSLFSLAGVRLTRFEIGSLEDLSGGPFFVGFQFAGQSWELLPDTGFSNGDKLAVKDPGFTIGYLGSSAGYEVDVYGTLAILGVQMLVSVSWPGLTISGSLLGEGIKVKELLKGLGLSGDNFDVTIDTLFLRADTGNKAYDFSIGFGKWTIPGIALQLSEITLDLSWFDGHTTGTLEAQITVAGVALDLHALYQDGALSFSGSTGPGQPIKIGALIGDLAETFKTDANVPAAIESLEFKNLAVSFNSATRDFTFKGEADFDVDGTPVVIVVAVDIAHDSNGLAQKRFSGVITFSTGDTTHEFDVVFADEKMMLADQGQVEVSTLLAAYRSTAGDAPSMRDLAPSAYKDLVPDIKTRGAFLAKQWKKTQAGEQSSKWLIGLSLEAGLDLSNVQLPNLPLMGSGGPPKSLKLDLQILAPTEPFDEADVAIIGRLNTSGGVNVPSHAVEVVAVATVLLLDGQTVTLNLPIKANPSPAEGQAAFDHDPTPPAIKTPAVAGAEQAVAVTPGVAVTADDTKWVKIQKNFGPIHIERVGLKYKEENKEGNKEGKLFIFLDGGLTAAGFTVSLQGLGVDTPLTKFDPHFHLSGIGLDYKGGGVELGGAFLQQEMQDPDTGESYTAYAGQAVLKTEQLSLSAIGSFFKYRGESSLFVYALLEYPLGGPPFFFVTGLAAGFGYNRRAIVPPVEQIHTYPLVTKAIAGPAAKGAAGAKTDLAAELAALAAYVPPELGEIFLAVGVKFTSFELIDSFGLIIAQFGEHNQFDLVGVSHLQIPAQKAGGKPGSLLAEIYMNWEAKFHADEGVVGLSASLVPGSYVFSPDCHLTGGFAYYAWFGGEHAGDFVYTVGGYHPDFHKPDHYPIVAPLALNWFIEKANLSLKGQLYYALTAHAFMAGGKLDASIQGGFDIGIAGVDFSADLHIAADFLITWQPYHYDAAVKLDLNIAISAHLLFYSTSFSLNVGGDMHIWGPEFAGEARIYLKVLGISHALDVTFGAGKPQLRPITWEKFSTAFLPQIAPPADDKGKAADQAAAPVPAKTDPHAICGVSVKRGLIRASGDRWVINAREFSLVTDSVIPIKQANRGEMPLVRGTRFSDPGGQGAAKAYEVATDFGIAPMGVNPGELTTVHTIRMTRDGNAGAEVFFRCEPIFKKVPSALWDEPRFEGPGEEFLRKPEVNPERQLVSGVLGGLEVLPAVLLHPSVTLPVERGELQYDTDRIADAYQWQSIPIFEADEQAGWRKVNETIQKTTETDAGSAHREQPWQVRQRLLRELGLGGETVIFGQPADQYALDAPQIEMV
ncbi:MAG: DUF6603 domain-containing protein [Anaerolineae bacterium]